MSGRILNSLNKRKIQLIEKEASKKYHSKGLESAIDHVEAYFQAMARANNPFEREKNIQTKSFVIDKTIVVKAYNVNTGFTYMAEQINLNEELEMDSEPSCSSKDNLKI